eukprot:6213942-Pleurochrysis_carterae.AAC.6
MHCASLPECTCVEYVIDTVVADVAMPKVVCVHTAGLTRAHALDLKLSCLPDRDRRARACSASVFTNKFKAIELSDGPPRGSSNRVPGGVDAGNEQGKDSPRGTKRSYEMSKHVAATIRRYRRKTERQGVGQILAHERQGGASRHLGMRRGEQRRRHHYKEYMSSSRSLPQYHTLLAEAQSPTLRTCMKYFRQAPNQQARASSCSAASPRACALVAKGLGVHSRTARARRSLARGAPLASPSDRISSHFAASRVLRGAAAGRYFPTTNCNIYIASQIQSSHVFNIHTIRRGPHEGRTVRSAAEPKAAAAILAPSRFHRTIRLAQSNYPDDIHKLSNCDGEAARSAAQIDTSYYTLICFVV